MKRTIIILITLITAYSARADYHYASHEGSNQYPYTSWATAADSIQKAINAASPHDTVYIGAGEWYETAATGFYDSVAILGMGMDSTYWHTDEFRTPALAIGDGCSVEYITFKHPDWVPLRCSNGGPSASIRNCKFIDSYLGVQVNGGNSEVTNCVFDSCGYAVDILDYSGYFVIRNNLILNTLGHWAFHIYSSSSLIENNIIFYGVPDVSAISAEGATIRNNIVIQGGSGNGISTVFHSVKYNNTVKDASSITRAGINAILNDTLTNNLILNCDRGITIEDSCLVSYNGFWNNQTDIVDWSQGFDSVGNVFRDPMLVSEYDVHLQAFSPCIDAGDPNILDVDGTRSDIGCYGGPGGCSYTYLDLAPRTPDSISVFVDSGVIELTWHYNTEADFNRYQVYRDTVPGFQPTIFDIIAEPDTSYYEDTDILPGTPYYYRLTSVDNQGNISDFSEEIAVLPTSAWEIMNADLPYEPRITSAYPNPFNSNIVIVYSASNLGPQPPQITLKVYDIQGRVVKTLVDERKLQGTYRAVWDGTNDNGEKVSSGTYIARISQWGQSAGDFPVKITLIK